MTAQSITCKFINSVWLRKARPDNRHYIRSLSRCADAQKQYLQRLLRRNAMSIYGKQQGFHQIKSVHAFQKQVPITEYNDYSEFIGRIARGERRVLTKDRIRLFEPTSGTGSGEKLIPYTAELQREFQRGIHPWIVSLYATFPDLSLGRSYWSISQPEKKGKRSCGMIPIGFDSDWNYLGLLGKLLYSKVAVDPVGAEKANDTTAFRTATLAGLLAASDLRLISIWSPSFLRLLLDWYILNRDDVLSLMASSLQDDNRVEFLTGLHMDEDLFQNIWPKLRVVSCWTDASSGQEAQRLSKLLPHAHIQGKGLISTEAFVSFPISSCLDPVLAIRSHFFEFIDPAGRIFLAHQLKKDREYSVIVTTGGGLYRYQTGDRVLVTGSMENVPTLRFVGRTGLVSDRYGEKLDDSHVSAVMDSLLSGLDVSFSMLAPDRLNGTHSYTLYVRCDEDLPDDLPERLDQLLQQNPSYRCCRDLGQIYRPRVFRVSGDPVAAFEETCVARGMRRGDVKLTTISRRDDWSKQFHGKYLEGN